MSLNAGTRSVRLIQSLAVAAIACLPSLASAQSPAIASSANYYLGQAASLTAVPADPHGVMGKETCVKCHASEVEVWKRTPHAQTFDELHRRPEAKQIATKLGLRSIKHSGRCVACHYTQQMNASTGQVHAISGVSCESCHGAARGWIDIHNNYGGEGITRLTETPAHRRARITNSVAAGMRNPHNVYLIAQSCLRCHTTADEELVNVGGHSVGSLDFEFVSWSQGTVRHNFVRTDGQSNDLSPPARLRVMFVAGIIAELEASLRATATATKKATYGVTVAQRAARAGSRVESVAAKIDSATLNQIVDVYRSVELRLNNGAKLKAAADQIARLGYEFAASTDGRKLTAIDRFIPTTDKFK